jgi:acetylornithine/N-succinyldiaminopimelate aminotransferase
MNTQEIVEMSDKYLFPTYARAPLALVRGEGTRVWDADGREYLDFFSSTVVTSLGHCHPALVAALEKQAHAIFHVSNLHYCEPQALLARRLVESSFADRVFLCNSGAEANEAAIKLARKYGHANGGGRYEIITALGSFHGRTLATIAATGQEKVRVGFEPTQGGFRYVDYGDVAAVERAVTERTIGVMVEPMLGEGGVVVPPEGYLAELRALCDRRELLLILDEVQTGIGRTGTLFAYERDGVRPDIVSLAKGLGSGVPVGAMLAAEPVAASFDAGSHGSTFGGNAWPARSPTRCSRPSNATICSPTAWPWASGSNEGCRVSPVPPAGSPRCAAAACWSPRCSTSRARPGSAPAAKRA